MRRGQLSVKIRKTVRRPIKEAPRASVQKPAEIRKPSVDLSDRVTHIVGNGPSATDFRKVSDEDFALGCNAPFVKVDATFICDHKFLYKIREKKAKVGVDVVVPDKLSKWITTNPKAKNTPAEDLRVLDIYDYEPHRLKSHSSAHYGAIWLARAGSREIHVWGCDSLVKNCIRSRTDEIMINKQKDNPGHGEKFALRWRENWKQVMEWFPTTKFIFHNIPSGRIEDVL